MRPTFKIARRSAARWLLAALCSACSGPEARVQTGIDALDGGDPTGALAQFDLAALEQPSSPVIELDRGVALSRLRRHDEAIAAFGQAIAVDDGTRTARLQYDLGTELARSGRSPEAIAHLRLALRIDPLDAQARHNLELILLSRKRAAATASTGLSDRLGLGHGDLQLDDRVVVRAQISPDPEVLRLSHYWFAHVFDRFDGREWANTGHDLDEQPAVQLGPSTPSDEYQLIEVLPGYPSTTLVGLERPLFFGSARSASGQRVSLVERAEEEVRLVGFRGEAPPYRYQVKSNAGPTDAGVPPLREPSRWKDLPVELDPRVTALSAVVVAGERDAEVAGARLVAFLRRDFRYTLTGADPLATDPLSEFLFVRRAGHCEEFATAVAVMLRTQGFASRTISGFSGGDRVGHHYELKSSQAHAWAQVFSPRRGWVTLDATPEGNRRDANNNKSQPQTKREANALLDRFNSTGQVRWSDRRSVDGGTQDW